MIIPACDGSLRLLNKTADGNYRIMAFRLAKGSACRHDSYQGSYQRQRKPPSHDALDCPKFISLENSPQDTPDDDGSKHP